MRLVSNGARSNGYSAIEHFIRRAGTSSQRVRTPLSFRVLERVEYNVRLTVRGSSFSTTIDGQNAGTWIDWQLNRGGIGFFSESGDSATVRWVQLTERDSAVGRMLGYFGLQGRLPCGRTGRSLEGKNEKSPLSPSKR
jgi:hypothetical protein